MKTPYGSMKHTDPNFWRYALATILLACGGVMIGDGVVRWFLGQSNSSIPAGCCAIFLGIVTLLGKKPKSGESAGGPEEESRSDES